MKNKITKIDYDNCLVNLTSSILKYFDCLPEHKTLKIVDDILKKNKPKNVVLFVCDGMGVSILNKNLDKNKFFNKYLVTSIDSVFPPTTAAATTSLMSGLYPNEHGWIGWEAYYKEINKVIEMLTNKIKDTNNKYSSYIAYDYYPYKTIFDLINDNTNNKAYCLSKYGSNKFNSLNESNSIIKKICLDNNKNFIYVYYLEPDETMHHNGTESKKTYKIVNKLNDSIDKICKELNDSLVIITADHGHVNCKTCFLEDYPDLFSTLKHTTSGDSRAIIFYIKKNQKKNFVKCFKKYFNDYFILLSKKEVLNNNIYGFGENNKKFVLNFGDYLAIGISNVVLKYKKCDNILLSNHSGITNDEIKVPLIIYRS